MPKINEEVKKQREAVSLQMKALNDKGMFPKGYGKLVLEIANKRLAAADKKLVTLSRVNNVATGRGYHEIIIDVLLEVAKENKLAAQLQLAKDLLD